MRVCRCRTHQKPVGARFFARALFPQTTLAIAGESANYPTSQMLNVCSARSAAPTRLAQDLKEVGSRFMGSPYPPTDHVRVSEDGLGETR